MHKHGASFLLPRQLSAFKPIPGDRFSFYDTIVKISSREANGYYTGVVAESYSPDYYPGELIELHKNTIVRKI